MKKKKISIKLTEFQHERAKAISKKLIGDVNVTGLIRYWITKYDNEKDLGEFLNR